jgi:hypothetical protein
MDINEYVKGKMKTIAGKVHEELPDGFGFVVLAFNFGEGGELMYVSNANREDVVKTMKEFIKKTKNTWGNDTGKY